MLQIAGLGGNRIFSNARGDRIASTGWSSLAALFDLETESTLFISSQIRAVHQLRFSSDGRSLVAIWGLPRGRPSYGVLDAADAREVRTIALGCSGRRSARHPSRRAAGRRFPGRQADVRRSGRPEGTVRREAGRAERRALPSMKKAISTRAASTGRFAGLFILPEIASRWATPIGFPFSRVASRFAPVQMDRSSLRPSSRAKDSSTVPDAG